MANVENLCSINIKTVANAFLAPRAEPDIPEYLVKKGVPFREAHEIVGGLVADCVTTGMSLNQRAGTERQNIRSCIAITETFRIALESFNLRQQIMREKNWLSTLQVRITRHDNIDMLLGEIEQRGLQRAKPCTQLRNLRFDVKTQIERDLIVPTACGVKLRTRGADSFHESSFDIHVHVFERSLPLEFPGFDLPFDRAQFLLDLSPLIGGYDSCLGKPCGVRDRSGDIVAVQPPIKRNRLALAQSNLSGGLAESSFSHG